MTSCWLTFELLLLLLLLLLLPVKLETHGSSTSMWITDLWFVWVREGGGLRFRSGEVVGGDLRLWAVWVVLFLFWRKDWQLERKFCHACRVLSSWLRKVQRRLFCGCPSVVYLGFHRKQYLREHRLSSLFPWPFSKNQKQDHWNLLRHVDKFFRWYSWKWSTGASCSSVGT